MPGESQKGARSDMGICSREGCKANALTDDPFCFQHSQRSDIIEKRKQARSKGGSRGKLRVVDSIDTIQDVKRIIAETLSEVRSSPTDNTVGKARAIGYLCGIALTAIEKADLEERIVKLETAQAEVAS